MIERCISPVLLLVASLPPPAIDLERTDEGEALRRGELDRTSVRAGPGGAPGVFLDGGSGSYTSPRIEAPFPLRDAIISWNIHAPAGSGVAVFMSFERENRWSGWYLLGRAGAHPPVPDALLEDAGGKVQVDWFEGKVLHDACRYRVSLTRGEGEGPRIDRVSVTLSSAPGERAGPRPRDAPRGAIPRLAVPFRSQRWEDARIASRICSPTSLAMVMAYRGVDRPTAEVAARAHDAGHDIYGNWPLNIHAAYSFGVPGKLARFRTWDDARRRVAAGQPIIISIRDPGGVLKGAPYERTSGHLLVLTGFDEDGNPHVNDPAADTEEKGLATYDRQQMERVWLDQGGLGYLLEAPR